MSKMLRTRLAAVISATTVGFLLIATPAHAAPKAPVAEEKPSNSATTAAGAEDLPPNVTMKVIGKLPKLNGPMDVYAQDAPISTTSTGVTALAAATLPYSFTLTGVRNYEGRWFRSSRSSVCKDIQIRYSTYGESKRFAVTLNGSSVIVPVDNVARSYCWSGVPTTKDLRFWYHFTDECGECSLSKVNGSGQVRYP